MATPEQITELRQLINDTVTPYEYEAPDLEAYITAAGEDVRKAAGQVWATKASRYAGLVDVTEGSSSRKNSQLYAQALKMAEFYGGLEVTTPPSQAGRSGTRPIVRV